MQSAESNASGVFCDVRVAPGVARRHMYVCGVRGESIRRLSFFSDGHGGRRSERRPLGASSPVCDGPHATLGLLGSSLHPLPPAPSLNRARVWPRWWVRERPLRPRRLCFRKSVSCCDLCQSIRAWARMRRQPGPGTPRRRSPPHAVASHRPHLRCSTTMAWTREPQPLTRALPSRQQQAMPRWAIQHGKYAAALRIKFSCRTTVP